VQRPPFHWFVAVALGVVLLVITVVVYQSMEGPVPFERAVVAQVAPPPFALQPGAAAPTLAAPVAEEHAEPIALPERGNTYLTMLVDWLGEAREREPARVEQDLTRLARLDAPEVRIYRWLGVIAHRRGDELAATAYFEHAVRLAPEEAADLFNLATLYLLQERYPEAIRTFDRVVRLQPPFLDDTYAYLGYCLDQMGAREEAQRAWRTAIEIDPNNAMARRYLGEQVAPAAAGPLPPPPGSPPPAE